MESAARGKKQNQQPSLSSAAICSSHPHQPCAQQSCCQIFDIILLWTGVGGQLCGLTSGDDHLAVVKGWWSAISQKFHTVILLWAGVGVVGYFTSCCCGRGVVVSYVVSLVANISLLAVVKSWWSTFSQVFHIILLWSRVGGQLLLRYFTSSCCGQGSVVSHHLTVINSWWWSSGGHL